MLIIFRHAPYGTSFTGEGVRVLSSLAAFNVNVQVLFMDDGIFGLLKGQNTEELGVNPLGPGLKQVFAFGGYEGLVDAQSLEEREITTDDLIDIDIKLVKRTKIHDITDKFGVILTF